LAKIIDSGENIPFPDDAYTQAVQSSSENLNPLIKIARQRYGCFELKSDTSFKSREKFETIYRQVITEYLNGQIKTIGQNIEKTTPNITRTEENKKNILSTIDSILEMM